ncbi:MAG: acyl-CoA thioesterase [Pikeienuella sp.]
MNSPTDTAPAFPIPKSKGDLPGNLWSRSVVFRHGQCDPAGIVYTPEFFNVFNQVIEAWFCECLGINYYEILGPRRTGLGYVQANATFFVPCMMGEEIEIFVSVGKVGRKSYALTLHAMKGDREALRGDFVTVATSLDEHKSIEIPEDIKAALREYAQTNI